MRAALKNIAKSLLPDSVVAWIQRRRYEDHTAIDEVRMIRDLCRRTAPGVMVDVGGHIGSSTRQFLELGWRIVAYEPDPENRRQFIANIGDNPAVQLSPCAVSNEERSGLPLFTSEVSTGISGLSAFHSSHKPTATVDTVRLDRDLSRRGVAQVNFLKIDVEGFDFFVLQGFDWSKPPRFVLYEFENNKTVPLGYRLEDSTAYMRERGYELLYSVWEPIKQYGTAHTWRGLFRDPPHDSDVCWGNVLCFTQNSDLESCLRNNKG